MRELIKKELLSLVLDKKIQDIIIVYEDSIKYEINSNKNKWGSEAIDLNLDTLGRLCKEWAWKNYFITIRSGIAENGGWANLANDNSVSFVSMDIPLTELEAIIKATKWVANEKELQK